MNPGTMNPGTAEAELPWLRLDRRMLLIHPVEEILRLLPVLIGTVVLGTSSGNPYWGLAVAGVLVVVGLLRWFTTTYRIGPVHVELRRGLLQRQELSIPRSRIRSVDVDQRVLHRLLGLAVVKIGTGQSAGGADRNRFELNGLAVAAVPALRAALLAAGSDPGAEASARTPHHAEPDLPAPKETEIARLDPRWVRYAPFSTTGLLGVVAVAGLAFQYGLGERLSESRTVERGVEVLETAGVVVTAAVIVVAVIVVASIAACIRYLLLYGNLRVTDDGRMLRIGFGLLRVRHTTLDRARLRGVNLREPLALRLVGAARLDAIMTGVAAERGESSLVLPSAPASEAQRVAAAVLTDAGAVEVRLVPHGRIARRRRFVRAMLPAAAIAAAGIAASVATGGSLPPALTVALIVVLVAGSAGLAWDRYRSLGHAVLPGRLITRGGSLDRQRVCLDAAGIVGWTVRQSFFQRRAGVATVIAATPAGAGHYAVVDIPAEHAWALVEAVTPGVGDMWVRR
ncbi:PH domain-containing protein [Rhodococcus chondri]|uniref:PH domain-containing protein n=1 Tax=Rhodococcus chondri TaxID=3065941 RepID=A0ABU7JXB2_9NOCA|nr:PH domain-containing protein [Rhodococcus sp. CC-R104]MEE2034525.1 PH domain-containing protein [Rhodococcus sp. CC-R104]